MKERQKFVVDGHRYTVYRFTGEYSRDLETKTLTMSMSLTIPTENIAPISPWVMQRTEKKDVTIVRYLSENGAPYKTIHLDFIGARCIGHSEEYDAVRNEVVLHFSATFEDRIMTDEDQRTKLNDLLN